MKALVPRHGSGLFTEQKLKSEYLAYMLRAAEQDILERVEIAGHGTRRLRTEVLTDFQLPLPPLLEQQRIVAYLSGLHARVDTLQRMQAASEVELDALLPAVLNKAFKGEL
jgi:type I restriction enzyme, S subunit